jgi:hypothetical protein
LTANERHAFGNVFHCTISKPTASELQIYRSKKTKIQTICVSFLSPTPFDSHAKGIMLRLAYSWHPNYRPECERGAYLSFSLVSTVASSADEPQFVQLRQGPTGSKGAFASLPLPHAFCDRWNDVVLMVRLYSYNSISPGVFEASAAAQQTRTWASQRTAYAMIPLETSQRRARYRMRSMLALDQPPKGWIEIDWNACRISTRPAVLPPPQPIWNAVDVAQGKDEGGEGSEGPEGPSDPSTPPAHAKWGSEGAVAPSEGAVAPSEGATAPSPPGALKGETWMRRLQQQLVRVCAPWTRAEQLHMDVAAPFICRGLRDKYAPTVYLPIGPVPCMVYLMSLYRGSFAEKLPLAYVDYLSSLSIWESRETAKQTPLEQLEWLHTVCTFPVVLRPYKLDAIDVCNQNDIKPKSDPSVVRPDWFDIMEASDPQPGWMSPQDKQAALHNPLVAAETGGLWGSARRTTRQRKTWLSRVTSLVSSSSSSSAQGQLEHMCAAGDQIDHDFQGAHMADQGNDCDSRVSSVAILFDRIQKCTIVDPAAYHCATSLFGDPDANNTASSSSSSPQHIERRVGEGAALALSAIAQQYVFVYAIVAALSEYDSSASAEEVQAAAYALRTQHREVLQQSSASSSSDQLSDRDHNLLWSDPLGFTCHVVGLWFPRTRWRLLCDRGVRFKQGGYAPLTNEPEPAACSLLAGVCDPSDNTHAMQFVTGPWTDLAQSSEAQRQTVLYDALHDEATGFPHARLLCARKPRSHTKEYMQYGMVVSACEATQMRQNPSVGDVIFVNAANRTYGVPMAQLLHPDALSTRLGNEGGKGFGARMGSGPLWAAEPMTEPITPQQQHDILECLNLIPRPAILPVTGLEHAVAPEQARQQKAGRKLENPSSVPTLAVWMTYTHWMQREPSSQQTYGDLFVAWSKRQTQIHIEIADDFTWIYDGCRARRITLS